VDLNGRDGGHGQALGSLVVTTPDPRIVLRGDQTGLADDPIVDHPRQPADYIHPFPDGPVWTWQQEWRVVGGVRLRVYELVVSIVLRGEQIGLEYDPIVDHPGQPADYIHTDGTVWTRKQRWRISGPFTSASTCASTISWRLTPIELTRSS
jgi:hypothetical protein